VIQTSGILTAKAALEIASGTLAHRPSELAVRLMLAQVLAESAFGLSAATLRGTNNWGAIHSTAAFRKAHAMDPSFGEIAHQDHLANGRRYIEWFRVYPSQLEGARDFLATVARATDLSQVTSLDGYVRALYRAHYFVGFGHSDEERIAGYRTFIAARLSTIDTALRINAPAGDPSETRIGPFAPLLERLFVQSQDEARHVYGSAFDALVPSEGVRMFAPPRADGFWPIAGAMAAGAAAVAAWRRSRARRGS
jgi:hypothetical protein